MVPNRAGVRSEGNSLPNVMSPCLGEEERGPLPAGKVGLEVLQLDLDRPPGPLAAVLRIPIQRPDRARISAAAVRCEDQSAVGQVEVIGGHNIGWLELNQDLVFRGDGNPAADRGDLDVIHSVARLRPRRQDRDQPCVARRRRRNVLAGRKAQRDRAVQVGQVCLHLPSRPTPAAGSSRQPGSPPKWWPWCRPPYLFDCIQNSTPPLGRLLYPPAFDIHRNVHLTDSIDTENLSTRGRSVWVHSSQVRLLDSSVP